MVACAVFIAVSCLLPAAPAAAISSSALSIVPKKTYVIEPGKSAKDTLVIRNLDLQQPLELNLRLVDFTFTDDSGAPKLLLAQDAPQTTWSLKPFINVPTSVTVPANSSKTIDMNVAIPAGHGAGSYYSAIVYSSGASEGGNVGLSASGVTLVFASIPGKVDENLKLTKFGAYTAATTGKEAGYNFITATEPQTMAYTLANKGNVTESPVGSITLKDMFGHQYNISDVNPNGSLALIGQSRTFIACVKLKAENLNFSGTRTEAKTCDSAGLWPGFYSAKLDIFYGQNGNNTQEIIKTAHFLYMPWWFTIALIIALLFIAYFAFKAVRYIRQKFFGMRLNKTSRR